MRKVMSSLLAAGLTAGALPFRPDLLVADLSFIPLELVLPALAGVAADTCDLVLMVKPQFEVGRAAVGDGVVREPALRASSVLGVARAAAALGLGVQDVVASPLPGPSGNVEYFLWLRADTDRELTGDELDAAVRRAVAEGPQ